MCSKQYMLNPPASIGIVGGGQLGKMLAQVAKRMGYTVVILDPTEASPASQVADKQIIGDFTDRQAIRKLAQNTDVITYEFEHINADILSELKSEGYHVYPSGDTLKKIQNKYVQKKILKEAGLSVPDFYSISSEKDMEKIASLLGYPFILKTCEGGYDGKGNYVVNKYDDIKKAYVTLGGGAIPLMAEAFVDFSCELSIMAARGMKGDIAYYPVAQNVHRESILHISSVPAAIDNSLIKVIQDAAFNVLKTLDDIGVFCIEMFLTRDNRIYINEIAPRPHNSGHYTIEACVTSQYEQQLRAVTGMPLGSTRLISPSSMVNILGDDDIDGYYSFYGLDKIMEMEGVYLHLYGKHFTKKAKKIGHITALGDTVGKAEGKAIKALGYLKMKPLDKEDYLWAK